MLRSYRMSKKGLAHYQYRMLNRSTITKVSITACVHLEIEGRKKKTITKVKNCEKR